MGNIWSVPRMWEGGTTFVIAGGPSVADHDLTPLHHRHVIGVNNAYQLGTWVDVVFFGDKKWFRWHKHEMEKWPNLIATNCPEEKFNPPDYVKRVKRIPSGWSTDQDKVAWNQNTGFSAINFASLLGAKTIVMIGFDMNSRKDSNGEHFHWHPEHPAQEHLKTSHDDFDRFLTDVHLMAKRARRDSGVTLINTSLESRIPEDVIPKKSLEEFLEDESRT